MPKVVPVEQAVIEVDVPAKEGEGKPRRFYTQKDGLTAAASDQTLWSLFEASCKKHSSLAALGWRPVVDGKAQDFIWIRYSDLYKRTLNLASGLVGRGVTKRDIVGLFSVNRLEWVLGDKACITQGIWTVPLYDTLGDEAIEFIAQQTEMKVCLVSASKVAQLCKKKLASLETLVLMDPVTDEIRAKAEAIGYSIVYIQDLEAEGEKKPVAPSPSTDLAEPFTIMYTSGTTGLPKGVLIPQRAALGNAIGADVMEKVGHSHNLKHTDIMLSYLPLAHVFERQLMTQCINVGARAGFSQGDALKLLDDIQALKPTFFASVPRLLNRIYDKVIQSVEVAGGRKKRVFEKAVVVKTANLRKGSTTHWLYDRLVFKKVRELLGGRVRIILTGSAPLSLDVLDFIRIAFGCPVYEGYGATETCAGVTLTSKLDLRAGTVGIPIPCNEVKLVDIPEMNYTSKDEPYPRGEICVRGLNIFTGYYKDEAKTREALDEDGWYHTGDVGMWDEKNTLRIIDRKKNIFKLAQGEYVAPEKIENVYQKCKFVAQSFVYGDSLKAYLVAVVVLDPEICLPWLKQNGENVDTIEDACKSQKLRDHILEDMTKTGKTFGLKSFEQVKQIHLESTLFSTANDLLSPTFKLRRPQAKACYQAQLDALMEAQDAIEAEKAKKENAA